MHTSSILLLLPFISSITAHTLPHARHAHAVGFSHAKHQRDVPPGRKLVRRRKRSSNPNCQVPLPGNSTSQFASSSRGGSSHHGNSTSSTIESSSTTSVTASPGEPTGSTTSTTSLGSQETATTTMSSNTTTPSSGSGGSSGGGGGVLTGLLASLFPVTPSQSWTTASDDSSAMSFSAALQPLTSGRWPTQGTAPDGANAMVASFSAGQFSLANGQGMNFYSPGDSSFSVQNAKEILFSYSAFFPDGYQFNKGGKMPGIYGGESLSAAKSCSGGSKRDDCFSARLMWRTNGMGEFYNYFPPSATQPSDYCSTPPMSTCNPSYGDSIGRGSFTWSTGQWTTVAQRFKLNDVGSSNGEQELFVNGQSVLSLSGLQQSVSGSTTFYGIMAQSFFGGSDDSWASPQDQNIYFKDWSLAILS